MYGNEQPVTWTTLIDNIYPGDTVLELADNVNGWNIGDKIVITSTDYDHTHAE